jgi:restriction system protein
MTLPRFSEMVRDMINPTLDALRGLGGSASNKELNQAIIDKMEFPEEVVQQPHGNGNTTEVEWRLAWVRTYLRGAGLVTNSARGVWALTSEGLDPVGVDPRVVISSYPRRDQDSAERSSKQHVADPPDRESTWKEELIETLLSMEPAGFERLCQRVLRESGFIEVSVTGRSGDGGIDGHGIIRVVGLISFPVVFQCKRWRNSVSASAVRELRGAMAGRADKGLLITTGSFTRDARSEATRDGVSPIDLIDGELLGDKLKELGLGVVTRQVESVEVEPDFFAGV